jgi:putative hydrolase of the HAD superfamily
MVMRGITALWFDLDDTLFDHTYSVCQGLDAIRGKYSMFDDRATSELAVLFNRALNRVYIGYLCGEIDFREMRRQKLELFYESAEVKASGAPSLDEFHGVYDEAYRIHRRATVGSIEVLKRFANNGTSLAILTNGHQAGQEEKLSTIGLHWMVPHLLTSERVGVPKPDPQIYEWALDHTGHNPENVLMVGDSLENDVEAALRCGLSAMLYAPGSGRKTVATTYGAAPVIKEWSGLLDFIGDARAANATL